MKALRSPIAALIAGLVVAGMLGAVATSEAGPPWARMDGNNFFTGVNNFFNSEEFGFSVTSDYDGGASILASANGTGNAVMGFANADGGGAGISGRGNGIGSIGVSGVNTSGEGQGVSGAFEADEAPCCGSAAVRGDSNATNAPAGFFTQWNAGDPNGWIMIGASSAGFMFELFENGDAHLVGTLTQSSSERFKDNIEPLEDPLETVGQLRGVSFDWKSNGRHDVGVIAEEVASVLPELVSYEKDTGEVRGVDYGRLTAVLIEAVKAQQAQIEELKSQVAKIDGQR